QTDLLRLRPRDTAAGSALDDRSVQVHACHSPMREVEVLHDQLTALFAAHPDLRPADVVVMTPAIATYAPCVDAVFGAAPRARAIPFTIVDRSARAEHPLVDAFLALLDLPGSRYEAPRLLALLDVEAVRRRFDVSPADLAALRTWVRASGVRW